MQVTPSTKQFLRFIGAEATLCVIFLAAFRTPIPHHHPLITALVLCVSFAWVGFWVADGWHTANYAVGLWLAFMGGLAALSLALAAIFYPW